MQSVLDRKITQSVVLTGDQITRLQDLARETGKSVSAVTRDVLTKFFQAEVTANA